MGLFDVFKKSKSEENSNKNAILVPVNGELLNIESVPDQVFSTKMMGDGFGINPSDGNILSPVSGTVEMIFDTKHAIGLKTDEGLEVLIHMGIDTVGLQGEGFEVLVKALDRVKAGDRLINMDLDFIKKNAKSHISAVIFTNLEENKAVKVLPGKVHAKEENRIELV